MYFLEKSLQKYDVIGDEACIRRTLHGGYKKPKECGVKQTFGIFGELSEEFGVKKNVGLLRRANHFSQLL